MNPGDYAAAAAAVDRPRAFKPLSLQDWFAHGVRFAAEKLQAFHWDLAFPEAFCDEDGPARRAGSTP